MKLRIEYKPSAVPYFDNVYWLWHGLALLESRQRSASVAEATRG